MRKIILLLFAVAILMGCATTYYDSEGNPVPKEQMAVLKAKAVRAHLQDRAIVCLLIGFIPCVVRLIHCATTGE